MKATKLALVLGCLAPVFAFTDTAPFYFTRPLESQDHYVTDFSKLSNELASASEQLCTAGEKLIIYRVPNLARRRPSNYGTYFQHVLYDSENYDLELGPSCQVEYGTELTSDASVLVVDLEEDYSEKQIGDFLKEVNVVVQGVPSFLAKKRGDELYEQVQADFELAKSMAAQEDAMVTILGEPSTSKAPDNLFTKYQFFTPGLWMTIIVTLFLFFVFFTALSWISSIEITYGGVEKQVNTEKKSE